jgi:hypothetical protein
VKEEGEVGMEEEDEDSSGQDPFSALLAQVPVFTDIGDIIAWPSTMMKCPRKQAPGKTRPKTGHGG